MGKRGRKRVESLEERKTGRKEGRECVKERKIGGKEGREGVEEWKMGRKEGREGVEETILGRKEVKWEGTEGKLVEMRANRRNRRLERGGERRGT